MQRRFTHLVPVAGAACLFGLALMPASAHAGTTTPPKVDGSRNNSPPVYSIAAQQAGEEGVVAISVRVRPNGYPSNVRVIKSSGFVDLDSSAVEAALGWYYVPAKDQDGDPHSEWLPMNVEFKLPPAPPPPPGPPGAPDATHG